MNLLFTELPSPKMHPANIGHDLTRDASPLCGEKKKMYLDRVLKLELFRDDLKHVPGELRTVFLTGAKVVANAYAPKTMGDWDDQRLEFIKFYTGLVHTLDPEIIFDAFITGDIHETVEYISVSAEAFEVLGRTPEKRKFRFDLMNTAEERELWFVHRGLQFINAGFESLTFGTGVPQKVIDLFAGRIPLVSCGNFAGNSKDPTVETPTDIAECWITQKQLEGRKER